MCSGILELISDDKSCRMLSMSMPFRFRHERCFFTISGRPMAKLQVTATWSDGRWRCFLMQDTTLSSFSVKIKSSVWPDEWVGKSTWFWRPNNSSNSLKAAESVFSVLSTWKLKSPTQGKINDYCQMFKVMGPHPKIGSALYIIMIIPAILFEINSF